jgi:hypothetical protein
MRSSFVIAVRSTAIAAAARSCAQRGGADLSYPRSNFLVSGQRWTVTVTASVTSLLVSIGGRFAAGQHVRIFRGVDCSVDCSA